MILKVLALTLLVEALTEMTFSAAPLQDIRAWIIKKTPALRSGEQGHLLECKYCTSIWVGAGVMLLATFADCPATRAAAAAIIIARSSNYAHLIYSWTRDAQINMRLGRKPKKWTRPQ